MGPAIREAINWLCSPTLFFVECALAVFVVLRFRSFFARKTVIAGFFLIAAVGFALALGDPNFHRIATAPDNVALVVLLASVAFFSWLALRRAQVNDERTRAGRTTVESELGKQRVLTWPDLVYIELICLVLCTVALIVWSIELPAPLEEPGSPGRTPNPSKAPWYFVGLQELLVYFDPWLAGVWLPGLIIVGLCALPYVDVNPKGNGYYTFEERPFAVSFFWVGFLLFWVSLLVMGIFLRGPNWSFFGPFEYWDVGKLDPAPSVDLSTLFWTGLFGTARPENPLLRELPGILLLSGYFVVLPLFLQRRLLKKLFHGERRHLVRYHLTMQLLLWFGLIPAKMLLRWTIDLKYLVALSEWNLNV